MLTQAVVLAGGLGSRLGERTRQVPKPMMTVGGRPFLEYVLLGLRHQGIRRVLLSVGYLAEVIQAYVGDGSAFDLEVDWVVEDRPAGTGGFLQLGQDQLDEAFFVVNGDTLFDVNLRDLEVCFRQHQGQTPSGVMALRQVADVGRYGAIQWADPWIQAMREKGDQGPGAINGGVYLLHRRVVGRVQDLPCSLERDVLAALARSGELLGVSCGGFFIDIGIPTDLERADTLVPQWWRKPVAFLDRDGVINHDSGYVCRPEDFVWTPGAPQAIARLNRSGYRVAIVTNQAGIGRGYYTTQMFWDLMSWMEDQLAGYGAHVDLIRYCPHHPTAGRGRYRRICSCRKPASGMLQDVLEELGPGADVEGSFMVGDKPSDQAAAAGLGLKFVLYNQEGNLEQTIAQIIETLTVKSHPDRLDPKDLQDRLGQQRDQPRQEEAGA